MHRIRLIHSNESESADRATRLRAAGYRVEHSPLTPETLKALRAAPPDAVVIDLSRIPSQGRDVAVDLRSRKSTRHVPIVFVDGAPEAVERVRRMIPDAAYTSWVRIGGAIQTAIANPPKSPAAFDNVMAGYSGTPLPKKLGIKEGSVVVLAGAPPGFEKTLGRLPPGATLRRVNSGQRDLTLWFVRSVKELERGIGSMKRHAVDAGLWMIWPKKASGVATDLSGNIVRSTGLASGIVDFKIAAIDETWSGLRFSERKSGK